MEYQLIRFFTSRTENTITRQLSMGKVRSSHFIRICTVNRWIQRIQLAIADKIIQVTMSDLILKLTSHFRHMAQ